MANEVVFLETQHCIAFVNIKPIVRGRKLFELISLIFVGNKKQTNCLYSDVVVIPKKIRFRAEDMTREEAADLFHSSRHIASVLEKHYEATSINFGIQDGPESGQSVRVFNLLSIYFFLS